MRRTVLAVFLAAATLVAFVTTPAYGQSTQTARGTVTAMSGNAVTIASGDRAMSFAIDRQTVVTATGAGTATRAAAAAGKSGPKFSELIKVGDAIEVVYRDRGGKLMAASVRRMRAPVETSAGAGKQKDVVNGTVESVTTTALMITGGSGGGSTFRQTFTIDKGTKVVGRGAGTASRAGKVTAPDLVSAGDRVSVSYHRSGESLHASEIRVAQKLQ
jgi:hypothetical protein